jgi:hypothetical protein
MEEGAALEGRGRGAGPGRMGRDRGGSGSPARPYRCGPASGAVAAAAAAGDNPIGWAGPGSGPEARPCAARRSQPRRGGLCPHPRRPPLRGGSGGGPARRPVPETGGLAPRSGRAALPEPGRPRAGPAARGRGLDTPLRSLAPRRLKPPAPSRPRRPHGPQGPPAGPCPYARRDVIPVARAAASQADRCAPGPRLLAPPGPLAWREFEAAAPWRGAPAARLTPHWPLSTRRGSSITPVPRHRPARRTGRPGLGFRWQPSPPARTPSEAGRLGRRRRRRRRRRPRLPAPRPPAAAAAAGRQHPPPPADSGQEAWGPPGPISCAISCATRPSGHTLTSPCGKAVG